MFCKRERHDAPKGRHFKICFFREAVFCWFLFFTILLASCQERGAKPVRHARQFRTEVRLKTTPVKQQGMSQLCWVYGMLATIETNHLMQGDSVNLSPAYAARMFLRDRAVDSYLGGGKEISTRGMMPMLTDIINRYGIVPYDSYPDQENANVTVLARKVARAEGNASRRRLGFTAAAREADDLMDQGLGYLPRMVFMLGAQYTPVEFAHSVCLPDEYEAYTSFSHHAFYRKFRLEVPDNQLGSEFQNLPIDSLMRLIEGTIRSGRAVCWEGDISEPGFDWPNGRATLLSDRASHHRSLSRPAKDGILITQQARQRAFERLLTTDDHCLELCGLAHDRQGRRFFLAKNSWGRTNRYGGYIYLSYNYVKMKTIAVCIPRSAK